MDIFLNGLENTQMRCVKLTDKTNETVYFSSEL